MMKPRGNNKKRAPPEKNQKETTEAWQPKSHRTRARNLKNSRYGSYFQYGEMKEMFFVKHCFHSFSH